MDLPPSVSSYKDRHGKTRFRYRRPGQPAQALPGQPGDPKFEAAYALAAAGQQIRPKPVRRNAPAPRTLRAAWLEVQKTGEWQGLKASSKVQQIGVAERFLAMEIAPKAKVVFGQMPVSGIRRGDVKKILGRFAAHPHAGEAVLRLLRKITLTAMDLEWIESDPTYRIKCRPKMIGHRAWTDEELAAYETRWPVGTTERLGYALALYTGQRRSDVAPMRWDAINGGGVAVIQEKTDTPLWIPIHPELKIVLDATPQVGETVLTTAYGKAFSVYGFGGKMADAIGEADLPDACRLHGLRKSAGRCLAEAGATTRQIMAILGHKSLAEAERYTREAAQRKLAQEGIDHWARPKLMVVK
jgi:integrase